MSHALLCRRWRMLVATVLLGAAPLPAQITRDSTATAFRLRPSADSLLPVLDDSGQVIPEDMISAVMKTAPRRKVVNVAIGALLGGVFFALVHPQPPADADCSIYEPCTSREKFYMSTAWIAGAIVGVTLGAAVPDGSIDRWQAVEILRERRRQEREQQLSTPPF